MKFNRRLRWFSLLPLFCLLASALGLLIYFGGDGKVKSQTDDYETITYYSSFCNCHRSLNTTVAAQKVAPSDQLTWCSQESTLRQNHQKVVAYSLYGSAMENGRPNRYFSILDKVPKQVKQFYPDWQIRVYHNLANGSQEHQMLCDMYCHNDNVDLCDVNELLSQMALVKREKKRSPIDVDKLGRVNRMFWRYLALLDPQVDYFMSRYVDAGILDREATAVRQWLQSEYTFHTMRDHSYHCYEIMGGLFDVKVHQRRGVIGSLIKAAISLCSNQAHNQDQTYLAHIFWPTVKDDVMVHDSHCCVRDWNALPTVPFSTQRIGLSFVSDRNNSGWGRPPKCPLECRPTDHKEWEYC